VIAPAALGFTVYTFLLMLQVVFSLAEEVFVGGTPMGAALRLFVDAVPHAVVLTIPMSFLFGVIIALGRLNGDLEITALQAAGLPVRRLFRPVLRMAVLLAVLNLTLTLYVLPAANRDLEQRKAELLASSNVLGKVTPRVIYDDIPGMLLYVHDMDEVTGEWRDVVVYDQSDESTELLMVADRGHLATRSAPSGAREPPWLVLEGVVTHRFDPDRPETYRLNTNQTQLLRLPIPVAESIAVNFSRHELRTRELIERAATGADPEDSVEVEDHRYAVFELHQRLAIPMACLTFGLLGVPLGVGSRSGGRGHGFVLSILAVLVYYVLYNQGEVLALVGRVPVWVGAWLPNAVLLTVGVALIPRMGRWLGEKRGRSRLTVVLQAFQEWRRQRQLDRTRRTGAAQPITGSIPVALQRRAFVPRFPVQLDRYVVRGLVAPFLGMVVTTAMLFVAVDVADKLDLLTKESVSVGMFVVYYKNLLPQVVADVTPMALMISVLIMLTILERRSELTALKACGISMYRVIVPVLLVSVVCTVALGWFQEEVLPGANRRALAWKDRIRGRSVARSSMANDRQWLFSREGSMLYRFLGSDPQEQRLIRLSVFRFDANRDLRLHLFAEDVYWRDGEWVASDGWMRRINLDGSDEFMELSGEMTLPVREGPDFFGQEVRLPEELGFVELGRHIERMVSSGYRPTQMMVRWHQKMTSPLTAVVLVLLALPYALAQSGRRTTTQGLAVAIFLGIGYMLLVIVCAKLGARGTLPPPAAAWAPPVVTTLFAINRLTLLKT
jgi:LPS export ABC transporter permease LptG/LPS export ABC transporter permease LptF